MKKIPGILAVLSVAILSVINSCSSGPASDLAGESLIPYPVTAVSTGGWFSLTGGSSVTVSDSNTEMVRIAEYLASRLKPATGFSIPVKESVTEVPKGSLGLMLIPDTAGLNDEWYELSVTKRNVIIKGVAPAGVFRGIQTLMQLFPAAVESDAVQPGPWKIATGTISDYPLYSYRGSMLDVSRHFFGTADVKRFIDLISLYKMNHLHLHLSDDQGWRIEIRSWPNLAKHGGSTQVGGGPGGYYTQEEYSDIVKYAAERYITIVPEIDMPGHTNAALASYPELNCDGRSPSLYTGTEVGFSTLCARKDITYEFVNDVVREISAITPGPWFHIGGDESHSTKPEDYKLFVEKVQQIVRSYGKTVLGWDEIATTELIDGAVSQYWGKAQNAQKAVARGKKVLFSPAGRAYLDMKYDKTTKLGLHWAGYIEVDKAYSWDPATLVDGVGRESIIGVEAPLWTETVTTIDEIEYMVFPRLPGIAEIGWSQELKRDWEEYKTRLARHGERFRYLGIDFYPSPLVPWENSK